MRVVGCKVKGKIFLFDSYHGSFLEVPYKDKKGVIKTRRFKWKLLDITEEEYVKSRKEGGN